MGPFPIGRACQRYWKRSLATSILLALLLAFTGCGEDDPDPATILDRALTRVNLSGFSQGPDGPVGGIVSVQALGFDDGILNERRVEAGPRVLSGIREALGSASGLRGLTRDLEYQGSATIEDTATDHVSGELEVAGLAKALKQAGGGGVGAIAGVKGQGDLENSLASAGFDLYAGKDDGVIRRLDLTLALDDPDNALPPTRIRFSLQPVPSGP